MWLWANSGEILAGFQHGEHYGYDPCTGHWLHTVIPQDWNVITCLPWWITRTQWIMICWGGHNCACGCSGKKKKKNSIPPNPPTHREESEEGTGSYVYMSQWIIKQTRIVMTVLYAYCWTYGLISPVCKWYLPVTVKSYCLPPLGIRFPLVWLEFPLKHESQKHSSILTPAIWCSAVHTAQRLDPLRLPCRTLMAEVWICIISESVVVASLPVA